jgi:predicted transcriptional regulator
VAGGFYEELAHQDGIHLPTAETRQQDVQRRVSQAMREATEIMNAEMTVQEALERARSSEFRAWPVCDSRGVIGVVTSQRLRQAANEGSEASI